MSSLEARLRNDLKAAMKSGAKAELDVLRMLLSEAGYAAAAGVPAGTAEPATLSDELLLKVLKKAVKTRSESIEQFTKGGRQDLSDRERAQISIIQRYLPAEVSDEQITRVVDAVLAELGSPGKSALGKVIKESVARLGGTADGSRVARIVAGRLG
ncbi:MAG: GatB/YqeY domain-containing protein [Planctomycetota bacterium]